jgi:hypothetical protein
MKVNVVNPSVAFISKPTRLWVKISNFPPYNSSSDFVLLFKPGHEDSIQIVLEGALIPSQLTTSAVLEDVQFTVVTPILKTPGLVDLEIYHRRFSHLKVLTQILFVDQSLPQVRRLTLLETGSFSSGGLPLLAGSSSEQQVAVSLSNVPISFLGQNWSVQGPFVREYRYSFSSESSGDATAVVKINNIGGSNTLQYGLLSFGNLPNLLCNSSCCSDSTCYQEAKCGNDQLFVCFSLVFFDDRAVEIIHVDSSSG